jgi:hypothetical protein
MMVNRSQDVKETAAKTEVIPVTMTMDGARDRRARNAAVLLGQLHEDVGVVSVKSETPGRRCGASPPPRSAVSAPDRRLADDPDGLPARHGAFAQHRPSPARRGSPSLIRAHVNAARDH